MVSTCEKYSSTTFIKDDTSHRMLSLQMLYIVTLTHTFKVTFF